MLRQHFQRRRLYQLRQLAVLGVAAEACLSLCVTNLEAGRRSRFLHGNGRLLNDIGFVSGSTGDALFGYGLGSAMTVLKLLEFEQAQKVLKAALKALLFEPVQVLPALKRLEEFVFFFWLLLRFP